VRKLRISIKGSSKRDGGRTLYFYFDDDAPLYLLAVYPKSKKKNITQAEKAGLRKLTTALKTALRKGRKAP
jgi:hypothetical protein